jgi:hypothetical protein
MTTTKSLSERPARRVETNRYRKRSDFCLDYDGSKYINSYLILDGDKETGIYLSDSGDSSIPNSNKRIVVFKDKTYPFLREAIFAYEDTIMNTLECDP